MSAYLYDEALVSRLREITGDGRIHIVPPEDAISFLAQLNKDKVTYPAIVVSRNGPLTLDDNQNQVVKLKGQTAAYKGDNTIVKARLLTFRMAWSIDIFSVDRYTCDEIVRELLFYFTTNPRFEVTIPYNLDIKQNFDIILDQDISDNSDLLEFPNRGEFFRETIGIYTENAHFYSSGRQYLVYAKPDVDTEDSKI